MNNKRCSVIIVSYNSQDFIEKCISSLLCNIDLKKDEVIVWDNNSEDKTVEKLKKFNPQIKLLESTINWGMGQGNNRAVEYAKGEYLFLLNPDTEIKSPFIGELIKFYESKDNIGMVGVKLVTPDGKIQESVKKLPTLKGAFLEFIMGKKNYYSQYVPELDMPTEVEAVYAAAVLIKKDLFDKLGGFSSKYFMYYEDVDLNKRLKELNKKIFFYPQIKIKHLVGATKSTMDRQKLNFNSSLIYHGFITTMLLQLIFFINRIKRKILGR